MHMQLQNNRGSAEPICRMICFRRIDQFCHFILILINDLLLVSWQVLHAWRKWKKFEQTLKLRAVQRIRKQKNAYVLHWIDTVGCLKALKIDDCRYRHA